MLINLHRFLLYTHCLIEQQFAKLDEQPLADSFWILDFFFSLTRKVLHLYSNGTLAYVTETVHSFFFQFVHRFRSIDSCYGHIAENIRSGAQRAYFNSTAVDT